MFWFINYNTFLDKGKLTLDQHEKYLNKSKYHGNKLLMILQTTNVTN